MSADSPFGKWMKNIPPVRVITISFVLVILAGAVLLALPFTTRSGESTPFLDALFTSTSATCVTGLIVFDTWTHWNVGGQIILLLLIQIGGLGLMTITTGFTLLLRRKLALKDLVMARETTNGSNLNVAHLLRMVLIFTFATELLGAAVLMIRFIPDFGAYGIWLSVFHSIAAFCNAGFDILGFIPGNSSMNAYVGDPLVCVTLALLITVGGLGFIVISDIYLKKMHPLIQRRHREHLNFHSLIVLISTVGILLLGTGLILGFEYHNTTLEGLNFFEKLNAAFFQTASSRTAGFASINLGLETTVTKLITILIMFVGASPASTGGGAKTTTVMVLLATVFSVLRGREDTTLLRRRIDQATVYRSIAIFFCAVAMILITSTVILSTTPGVGALDALFEATSAFSTTGVTTGITPSLSVPSKIAVIITMFIGRVGPVSIALSMVIRKIRHSTAILPEGKIIVG